jgi:dCTP deaminase
MSFLGDKPLEKLLPSAIEPFDSSRLKSAHYELSIGEEAFVTGVNSNGKTILDDKKNSITIEPGQFALLLTLEKVTIPENMIAFISIKAGQKFKGLVNISGFHVDPGFEGKLLFSVYNAGASKILLERGQKCFLIWFSHLDGSSNYDGKHNNQDSIPIRHIENLSGDLASPNSVLNKINELERNYERRISSAEGNNTTARWMLGILISLLLGLNIKQYYDSNKYKSGFEDGTNFEAKVKKDRKETERIINRKFDSVFIKNDTTKIGK